MKWIDKMLDKEMELRNRYEKRTGEKWHKEKKPKKPLTLKEIEKQNNTRLMIAIMIALIAKLMEGISGWICFGTALVLMYMQVYLRPKLLKKINEEE